MSDKVMPKMEGSVVLTDSAEESGFLRTCCCSSSFPPRPLHHFLILSSYFPLYTSPIKQRVIVGDSKGSDGIENEMIRKPSYYERHAVVYEVFFD